MAPHQRARNAIQCSSRAPLPNTFRFAIRFAYDGTDFQGYQSQGNPTQVPTIQDEIEHRLRVMLRRKVRVLGWGRTDAGVHANGAVCTVDLGREEVEWLSACRSSSSSSSSSCKLSRENYHGKNQNKSIPVPRETGRMSENHDQYYNNDEKAIDDMWQEALSKAAQTIQSALKQFKLTHKKQPMGSITARRCTPVPPTFDARFSCLWKRYIYTITCSKCRSPFLSRYSWQMDSMLDYDAMVQAVHLLNGRHDFSWLSVVEPGDRMHPIRDLTLGIQKMVIRNAMPAMPFYDNYNNDDDYDDDDDDDDVPVMIQIIAQCDFFLYKMMRRIVGLVVAIGRGQVHESDLESCLAAHDAAAALHRVDDAATTYAEFANANAEYDNDNDGCNILGKGSSHDVEKIAIPRGLVHTAPAHGLTLDHVEYGIRI